MGLPRRRRGASAVATVILLTILLPACGSARSPRRFYLLGDSLASAAAPYWERNIRAAGGEARTLAVGGTAVCDLLADLPKVVAFRPHAVVVSYIGNLLSPCLYAPGTDLDIDALVARNRNDPRYLEARYRGDLEVVVDELTQRGIRVYLVTAPRPREDPVLADAVADGVRDIALRRRGDGVEMVDGGRDIAPGRAYAATQPCLPGEPCAGPVVDGVRHNNVRYVDGTHFDCQVEKGFFDPCLAYSSGAFRYGRNLSEPLVRDFRLRR